MVEMSGHSSTIADVKFSRRKRALATRRAIIEAAHAVTEPDAAQSLRIFVRGAGEVFARAAATSEVLRAAARTDDEIRRTHDYHENLRRIGFRQVLEILQQKAPLRAGRTLDEATDAFMTIYGDSTYHLLTSERGWSHDMVIEWLCEVLPELLLDDSG
jgi:hypothetical protein